MTLQCARCHSEVGTWHLRVGVREQSVLISGSGTVGLSLAEYIQWENIPGGLQAMCTPVGVTAATGRASILEGPASVFVAGRGEAGGTGREDRLQMPSCTTCTLAGVCASSLNTGFLNEK